MWSTIFLLLWCVVLLSTYREKKSILSFFSLDTNSKLLFKKWGMLNFEIPLTTSNHSFRISKYSWLVLNYLIKNTFPSATRPKTTQYCCRIGWRNSMSPQPNCPRIPKKRYFTIFFVPFLRSEFSISPHCSTFLQTFSRLSETGQTFFQLFASNWKVCTVEKSSLLIFLHLHHLT